MRHTHVTAPSVVGKGVAGLGEGEGDGVAPVS